MKKLNPKSTKTEMIKAYNELAKAYKELESRGGGAAASSASEGDDEGDDAGSGEGGEVSIGDIIAALNGLRGRFGDASRTLQQKLISEATTLGELRAAIAEDIAYVKSLHGIDASEGTLDELLKSYSETAKAGDEELSASKKTSDAALEEQRLAWKKEQEERARASKEEKESLKKSRAREAAEHDYEVKQRRAADDDAKAQARKAFEAELTGLREAAEIAWGAREKAIGEREKELSDLRAKKEAHPKALEAAVKKAEEEGTWTARKQAKVAADLQAKENEGKRRVFELRIQSHEATIKKQAAQIENLTKQLATALKQAQDLAVKAIEGASNATSFEAIKSIAMEQAKNSNKGK
ncbi:MAG: hypothetical protein KC420_05800 [Myxococcales bacterium]|nr:hypothetical protein [Myxococcales bacterium]